jgi:hypothetical protein
MFYLFMCIGYGKIAHVHLVLDLEKYNVLCLLLHTALPPYVP